MKWNGLLKTWRTGKGWNRPHFAKILAKKTGKPITASHIEAWEDRGVTPAADIGVIIYEMSGRKVKFEKDQPEEVNIKDA